VLAVESPQAFKNRPKDTSSIQTLLPHGHYEKTSALRADILSGIFIYRMDIKTKKKKLKNVHPGNTMPSATRGFF
jgi:hypothetical protein